MTGSHQFTCFVLPASPFGVPCQPEEEEEEYPAVSYYCVMFLGMNDMLLRQNEIGSGVCIIIVKPRNL